MKSILKKRGWIVKEAAGDYFVSRMPGLIIRRNAEAAGERIRQQVLAGV
jgi:hypothetical protein